MAALDEVEPISNVFEEEARQAVLEVKDMKINGDKFTFKLPDALSHIDEVENANRIVVTDNKEKFLEDPTACAAVSISHDDLSREGYNLFSGTAEIGVNNLKPEELQQAVEMGCAVAEIQDTEQPAPETEPVQVASLDFN